MSTTHAQSPEAEELNLKQLLAALRRRWPFIPAGIAVGALAAVITTSLTKPTWEGSFEIVLASQDQGGGLSNAISSNPMLTNLLGRVGSVGKGSELKTSVKILQSTSVLRPVFDEVRAQKAALGEDTDDYSFSLWAKGLSVQLEKGTAVLSISYRDTDKSLILPVLRDISEAYQNYSIRERNESLTKGLQFAEQQTRIYRDRSEASNRALNSFALTYGITSDPGTIGGGSAVDLSKFLNSGSISNSGPALNIKGTTSRLQSQGDPLHQLSLINQELIRLEQTFTDNDPSVIQLKRDRDALRRYIETSSLGKIAYPGREKLSRQQAQNILLRYQTLERTASRDQSTLETMEGALLSLQLEQARSSTPWKLISTPTLLERPVAPRPLRNLLIWLASGLFLGCAAGLVADQRSGKIFDKEQLKKLLPVQLLLELPANQAQSWNDSLRLLGRSSAKGGSLAILPLGEVEPTQMNRIRDILKQACNSNIEICHSTFEATNFDKLLLVAAPGSIDKPHLDPLIREFNLQQTPIIGWIWLE